MKLCSIEDCNRAFYCRTWCRAHYSRWQRSGDPLPVPKMPEKERFWARVDKTSSDRGCWLWTGAKDTDGYGCFYPDSGKEGAHRVSYTWFVGPIPSEQPCIDHICHDPSCVNPDHLRAVTHTQNMENKLMYKNNTSGYRGVTWHKGTGKYMAQVKQGGKNYHLGLFTDPAEAGKVALAKRLELQTHNDLDRI